MVRALTGFMSAFAMLALNGCIPITLHESKLETTAPERVAALVVGETTRTQVRELLGEPLIASEYWRFDAFRMKDANVGVVVFPPYVPIPAWTTETAYAVVSYAEDGRVADTGWTSRMSGVWSIGRGDDIAAVSSGVRLDASGGTLLLAASPERRDAFWGEHPPHDRCRVVIGIAVYSYDAMIRIDGSSDTAFPDRVTPLSSGLVAIDLAPGRHRIEATGTDAKFSAASEFECSAGDYRYVVLDIVDETTSNGHGHWRGLDARLEVSSELPLALLNQRLLIWANRQWLVPQEPNR